MMSVLEHMDQPMEMLCCGRDAKRSEDLDDVTVSFFVVSSRRMCDAVVAEVIVNSDFVFGQVEDSLRNI